MAATTPEIISAFTSMRAAEVRNESLRNALHNLSAEERIIASAAFEAALDAYAVVIEARKTALSATLAGLSEVEKCGILRALEVLRALDAL